MPSYLDYPFGVDGRGWITTTDRGDQIRDMIYQVLLTSPGERVNRPDFGCGLATMLFEGNNPAAEANIKFLVRTALQRWLADAITVETVTVLSYGERLQISIEYVRLDNGQRQIDQFTSF